MTKKIITLVVSMMFLVGCQSPYLKTPIADKKADQPAVQAIPTGDQTTPKYFSSLADLKQFLAAHQNLAATTMMAKDAVGGGANEMMLAKTTATPQAVSGDTAQPNYTKTNNQVEGVDEADIVKTDGNFLYYGKEQAVEIIKSFPATEAKRLAELKMPGSVNGIFLYKNRLVVYGQNYNWQPPIEPATADATSSPTQGEIPAGSYGNSPNVLPASPVASKVAGIMPPFWGGDSNYAYLTIYDVSDPASPSKLSDLRLEGNIFGARLIDKYLYLVTDKYSYDPIMVDPLPRLYINDKLSTASFPRVAYFDMPYSGYSFTAVNALDLSSDNFEPKREVYLLDGQKSLYVSEKNLYFGLTKYLNEQELLVKKTKEVVWSRLTPTDQATIQKIEDLPEEILSKDEKLQKTNLILLRFGAKLSAPEQKKIEADVKTGILTEHPKLADELITTDLHRISLNGLEIAHVAEGRVPGQLLNQFSLDEKDGNLRVAVTRPQGWSNLLSEEQKKSSNNLYVLDSQLKAIGSLEGLAPTEQIYAARFMGDRAYLVTFVQTDPLFVIDLKDPTQPKLLGELKLPGFSNYLHPYDENTLIGLGKDTETSQWGGQVASSLKIALFDVSNPATPMELSSLTLGDRGSDSAALYDHLAFTFSKEKNLLALPISLTSKATGRYDYGLLDFNGSVVLDLANKKIVEKGRVSHNVSDVQTNGVYDYQKAVRRNLIIENNLYTLSDARLKINDLANFKEINRVDFQK
jgi:uncharacterized secreted protein with C-terminal beta-propeller domain